MSEGFDIRVEIRQNLKKDLILGQQSRLSIGLILGFIDYRSKVIPLL